MRILQLLSQTHLTGAEVYAFELSQFLSARGHKNFVVSDKLHLPWEAEKYLLPIDAARGLKRGIVARRLRKFIIENKIDVIHTHSRAAVRIAWWATAGLKVSVVSTVHGNQHWSWSKRVFDLYGDRIIAICENVALQMQTQYKTNPRRLSVIRNPVKAHPLKPANGKMLYAGRTTGPKGEILKFFLDNIFPEILDKNKSLQIDLICDLSQNSGLRLSYESLKNKFPDRFLNIAKVEPGDFDNKVGEYDYVVGSGRVAIAAALQARSVFVVGEIGSLGWLSASSWADSIKSNFGDIDFRINELILNRDNILQQFSERLALKQPVEDLNWIFEQARKEFSHDLVCDEIEKLYHSAWVQKQTPKNIPILMYHQVTKKPIETKHRIFVTEETFERHIRFLKDRGFKPLFFRELLQFKMGTKSMAEFPSKPIIITFDDGYVNNLELALPVLRKYNFKATIFLLADNSIPNNYWDEGEVPSSPLLNPEQRKQLVNSGIFEIGSHGFKHEKLPHKTLDEALFELTESKRLLEQELSQKVCVYAFTYGDTNPQLAKLAGTAGYDYAINTDTGGLHWEENPLSIFRVSVFPQDGWWQLWKKTSSWYRKYYFRKRGK